MHLRLLRLAPGLRPTGALKRDQIRSRRICVADPSSLRFLLRSKSHHEILSTLLYGITSQKGLMALIGDVGTGKTTLCRALLREPETPILAQAWSGLALAPSSAA